MRTCYNSPCRQRLLPAYARSRGFVVSIFTAILFLFVGTQASSQARVDTVQFDTVECGSSICATVQVRSQNAGEEIAELIVPDSSPFAFDASVSVPLSIPDNDSVAVDVCFSPEIQGVQSGILQLVIEFDDNSDTVDLYVSGYASGPSLLISPNPVFFPETQVGARTVQTVVIVNTGDSPQDVQMSSLSGIVAPFSIVGNISSLVALDFLGFGLPAPTPSWGELIHQGTQNIFKWHLVVFPPLAMFLTLQATVFIGEAAREAFDPQATIAPAVE